MQNLFLFIRIGLIFGIGLLSTAPGQAQRAPSPNWAGFETISSSPSFYYIYAQWTVPAVTFVDYGSSASQEKASVWVGIGGISGRSLLQAGTDSTANSSGAPSYIAWFQTVPDAGLDSSPLSGCHMLSGPSSVPCNVSAGDTIDVEIVCNQPPNCSVWSVGIVDMTQSWAWGNGSINFTPDQYSAEFIVEAPNVLQGTVRQKLPLPDFGTVVFDYAQVAPNQSFTVAGNGEAMKDPSGGCANPTGAAYDDNTKSSTLTIAYMNCTPKPYVGIYNTHDFNGDGISDLLWQDTSGNLAAWLMNGAAVGSNGSLGNVSGTWSIVGQRDFNGDGDADLLWRDAGGNLAIWFLSGTQLALSAGLGNVPTNWGVFGTGDFNHDGNGDILWRDSNTGAVSIWFLNGSQVISTASLGVVPTNWSIAGSDAIGDILWRDTSGNLVVWAVSGSQVVQSVGLGNVPLNWQVAGLGDFNGDGFVDILWRDMSGDVSMWLLNNGQVLQSAALGTVPTTWSIAQTGDYDGDGKSDLIWRDGSGNTAIWFMSGTAITSTGAVGNIPTGWTVQSVNAE
jgi:hypothetical protein